MHVLSLLGRANDQSQNIGLKFKIDGGIISGSCYFLDPGCNFTVYFNHTHMIKYMLRNTRPGTYHHVWGSAIVNAFISDKTNRACASMNVNATEIGIAQIQPGGIIDVDNVPFTVNITNHAQSNKYKLLMDIFLLQHWNEENALGPNTSINFELADQAAVARDALNRQRLMIQAHFLNENTEPVAEIVEAVAPVVIGRRRRLGVVAQNERVVLNEHIPAITIQQLTDENSLDETPLEGIIPLIPINPVIPDPQQQQQQQQLDQQQQQQQQQQQDDDDHQHQRQRRA